MGVTVPHLYCARRMSEREKKPTVCKDCENGRTHRLRFKRTFKQIVNEMKNWEKKMKKDNQKNTKIAM